MSCQSNELIESFERSRVILEVENIVDDTKNHTNYDWFL